MKSDFSQICTKELSNPLPPELLREYQTFLDEKKASESSKEDVAQRELEAEVINELQMISNSKPTIIQASPSAASAPFAVGTRVEAYWKSERTKTYTATVKSFNPAANSYHLNYKNGNTDPNCPASNIVGPSFNSGEFILVPSRAQALFYLKHSQRILALLFNLLSGNGRLMASLTKSRAALDWAIALLEVLFNSDRIWRNSDRTAAGCILVDILTSLNADDMASISNGSLPGQIFDLIAVTDGLSWRATLLRHSKSNDCLL